MVSVVAIRQRDDATTARSGAGTAAGERGASATGERASTASSTARWVMGGGSSDRGLRAMREAAAAPGDFYSEVEAEFALWEMLVRDGKRDEAVPVARELLVRFPENEELAKFIAGP